MTLSELRAAHGHSVPGPITVSDDGAEAFVAEAGVLALIRTSSSSSWSNPTRVEPISSRCVRATELLLDPDADYTAQGDPANRLLYVAGGRMGLWVMQADRTAAGPLLAARIDDANAPGVQESRRWVNDLDVLEMEGTRYLLALFAAKDDTRLRLYELTSARNVLSSGLETGSEIWPDLEVTLPGNPAYVGTTARSFGYGMAVDGTDVYVALGMQGLVRVRFCGASCTPTVQAGPFFGDGSTYAQITTGAFAHAYDDFARQATHATQPPKTYDQRPPYVLDVAIEREGSGRYLWCAADHLGVLRFDISDPASFGPAMAIEHQEGGALAPDPTPVSGITDHMIRLLKPSDAPGPQRGFAHRLSLVETPHGRALAAAVLEAPYFQSDGLLDEGRLIDYRIDFSTGAAVPYGYEATPVWGSKSYTLLYDLDQLVPNPPASATNARYSYKAWLDDVGGRQVRLAPEPPNGQMVLLGAKRGFGEGASQSNFLVRYDWPAGTQVPNSWRQRVNADRPGRHCGDIGFLPSNPDVLLTATNDAGLPADGILTLCGSTIRRDYLNATNSASFGIVFNPFAVWPKSVSHDYVLGAGPVPGAASPRHRWMLADMFGGGNVCPGGTFAPPAPQRVKRIYIDTPPGRYGELGRGWYIGGSRSAAYNQHLAALQLSVTDLVLAVRDKSTSGLVALREDRLIAALESSLTSDGELITVLQTGTPNYAFLTNLETHPEYANLEPGDTSTFSPNFIDHHQLGELLTHFPHFTQIPGPGGPQDPWWVIVTGAGTNFFPPEIFLQDTTTQPDPVFQTFHEHSLVQVFLAEDPTPITDLDPTTSPQSYTLVGPSRFSHAYRIEPFEWDERHYLVVADLGGALQLWDLSELLATPEHVIHPGLSNYGDFLLEEWRTPEAVTDDLSNTVWGLRVHLADLDSNPGPDEAHVYAVVGRVGIEVLRLNPDPDMTLGQTWLQFIDRIETPSGSGGIQIRTDSQAGESLLLFAERDCGIRVFEKP